MSLTAAEFDEQVLTDTPAGLPLHQAAVLDDAARAALPALEWHAYTDRGHIRSETPAGGWYIGPQIDAHEPVRVSFQLPLDENETLAGLYGPGAKNYPPNTVGRWRRSARTSPQELGYVLDQETACWALDALARVPPQTDPEALLKEAGFEFAHRFPVAGHPEGTAGFVEVFRKSDARGLFSLYRHPCSIHLTREPRRGGKSWLNLFRLSTANELQDGTYAPLYWPSTVAEPLAAALAVAIQVAECWQPEPKKVGRARP